MLVHMFTKNSPNNFSATPAGSGTTASILQVSVVPFARTFWIWIFAPKMKVFHILSHMLYFVDKKSPIFWRKNSKEGDKLFNFQAFWYMSVFIKYLSWAAWTCLNPLLGCQNMLFQHDYIITNFSLKCFFKTQRINDFKAIDSFI